jgi:predicted dehydrogenase
MSELLRVGIVGCGVIGRKRAEALGDDRLVAVVDTDKARARALASERGASVCHTLDELLGCGLDVVVVATTHDALAATACAALATGAHVLVEKPAGRTLAEIEALAGAAAAARRLVKVGFNHRFHPGIARAVAEARSGTHGDVMFVRARYGHGGRLGYEHEWRADRTVSGGGELIDQGMHLLDLLHWLLGPVPLHSALLRTSYWPIDVEDNAVIVLAGTKGPWALFHTSWSEWRNEFSLEVYCRSAKLDVSGLARSYGQQVLRIYRMRPELGPPDVEEIAYPPVDASWAAEWQHFREAIGAGACLLGDIESARYAHGIVAAAYAAAGSAHEPA